MDRNTLLSRYQQKFILKLYERELFSSEQNVWIDKKWFYRNASYLIRGGLVKTRRDYNNKMNIYSLTPRGQDLAKILIQLQEVRFK